jgi:uncharacterized protein YndB with AHSA1/START domain
MRSTIHLVRDYPHPPAVVWRALTDPDLILRWTASGAGARTEGFAPVVGTRFSFVAKPRPGWSGIVACEVLEAAEPALLRYSWQDASGGAVTEVTYRLEAHGASGTRFTYDHAGFTGLGGAAVAAVLRRVRSRMLDEGPPALLDAIDSPTSAVRTGLNRSEPAQSATGRITLSGSTLCLRSGSIGLLNGGYLGAPALRR